MYVRRLAFATTFPLALLAFADPGCGGTSPGYFGGDGGGGEGEDGGVEPGDVDADVVIPGVDMARRPGAVDMAKPRVVDMAMGGGPSGPEGAWPAGSASMEDEVLVETNKRRAAGANCRTKGSFGPAGPLTLDTKLRTSARLHSKDMAVQNYFAHNSLDGRTPFDRMRAAGFAGGTMGENIAAGNATAAETVQQWMDSDGHCANIMNKSYRFLGVGYYFGANARYRHYWTQNFGG